MKEKIIGVDYNNNGSTGLTEIEITIVEGIKPIWYERIIVKELESVFTVLVLLTIKFNAKINFENNVHGLYLLFKKYNRLDLLRNNDIPKFMSGTLFAKEHLKGFTYTQCLKDLFYEYSNLLEYNKDFEDSYRIAVLPILYDRTTQCILSEIKRLEKAVKKLKESL